MRLAYLLNRCLEFTTGEYIARMDGDDLSATNRLEKQVNYVCTHKNIQLVGTYTQRFNKDGFHDIVPITKEPDRNTLRKSIPFFHATIMTYKKVFDEFLPKKEWQFEPYKNRKGYIERD